MATKRVKQYNEPVEEQEVESMSKDRISDLSNDIIINILSFLPTIIAVRMSLLSQRWKRMWTLVHVLDFYDRRDVAYFRKASCYEKNNEKKKFLKFVDECLKHPFEDTTITKFKLKMDFYGGSSQVDNWLTFPVKKKVKELDLDVTPTGLLYCLPNLILYTRTLTLLKLKHLELTSFPKGSLPSLKVLYLANLEINDEAFNNLLRGCPCLEKLHVHGCYGVSNPKVMSLSLKSMEYYGHGDQTVEVEAMNLHSFVFGGSNGTCNINLKSCAAIRNLSFSYTCLNGQWFEDLIPQLPFLENLILDSCFGSHIKIMNQHLRKLDFDCRTFQSDFGEATIVTPSLVSIGYSGYSMFKIFMIAPNLLDAKIKIYGRLGNKSYGMEWYTSLINFFSKFNGSKNVHIFCGYEKALIIPNELREIYPSPLPNLKHLKVETGRLFRKELKKSLLWISPSLETLSIE